MSMQLEDFLITQKRLQSVRSDRLGLEATTAGGGGLMNAVIQPSETRRANEPQGLRRADGDFSQETLLKVIYFKRKDTATYAVAMGSAKSITDYLTKLDVTAKLRLPYKVSDNRQMIFSVRLESIEAPVKTYSIITAKLATTGKT